LSPRAARTSDDPDAELAARLPCLTTGRHGGHVDRAEAVATGANDVESHRVDQQGQRVLEDGVAEADHLVDGLPLCPERDEEAGKLGGSRLPVHHLLHGP
jgi:hypothetical protein